MIGGKVTLDDVKTYLERRQISAGPFALPHWRNALKEIQLAKDNEARDKARRMR